MTTNSLPPGRRFGLKIGTIGGVPLYIGGSWPFVVLIFFLIFQGTAGATGAAGPKPGPEVDA